MTWRPCAVVAASAAPLARAALPALHPDATMLERHELALLVLPGHALSTTPAPRVLAWLCDLHAQTDVLPICLSDELQSLDEAAALLDRHAPTLQRLRAALRDRVEFTLRLWCEARPATIAARASAAAPGAAYLRDRAAHYAQRDGIPPGLAQQCERWLQSWAPEGTRARLEGATTLRPNPCLHLLCDRTRVDALRERFASARDALGLPCDLTGPFPPSIFVRGALGDLIDDELRTCA